MKDALERKLHKLVCAGKLDLKTAQRGIASDWTEAYKKYVRARPAAPMVHEAKTAPATTANEVWVNREGRGRVGDCQDAASATPSTGPAAFVLIRTGKRLAAKFFSEC